MSTVLASSGIFAGSNVMRVDLRRKVVALLILLSTATPSWTQSLPAVCAASPQNFFAERTDFIDDEHKKLVVALADPKRSDRAVERLRQRIATELKSKPLHAAILQVELLQRDVDMQGNEQTALRATIRERLSAAPDNRAAVEAMAAFSLQSHGTNDDNSIAELQKAALGHHRRLFGETPRQFLLWTQLYKRAPENEKIKVAQEILTASEKMASASILFQARLSVFRHLPLGDPERQRLAAIISAEAVEISRTLTTGSQSHSASCFEAIAAYAPDVISAFAAMGRAEERKTFLTTIIHRTASNVRFGTHAQFILEDISSIVAARAVDFDAYLSAVGRIEAADDSCAEPKRPAVICNLISAAEIMLENNRPALGLTLLKDALQATGRMAVDDALKAKIRIALAHADWQHGAKAAVVPEIASIPSAEIEQVADNETIIKFHKLRAEIAEALLDPRGAGEAFATVVDKAVAILSRTSEEDETGGGGARVVRSAADELVWKHLRGRFCVDCGQPIAAPALKWLNAIRKFKRPRLEDVALAVVVQQKFAKSVPGLADEKPHVNALKSALGAKWKPLIETFKRQMKHGASDLEVTRTLALALAVTESYGSSIRENDVSHGKPIVDDFAKFLFERDTEKQEKIWEDKLGNLNGDANGLDWFHDALERAAHLLEIGGYAEAAQTVLLYLVKDIEPTDADEPQGAAGLVKYAKTRAAFWGDVYARLAAYEGRGKSWKEANEELDRSQNIIAARLDEEWSASADRIGPLLRELRPTLSALARLRVTVATGADGAEQKAAKAFEALQWGMVGETAAGMQASLRRRLTTDPALARVIADREVLKSRLDLAKLFDETVGVLDPDARNRELATISGQLAEAERRVTAMLPVAESIASLRPLALAEARALLQPGEALLMMHTGGDGVFASILEAGGEPLFWVSRFNVNELEQGIREVRRGLDGEGRLPPFPLAQAHDLFKKLLGPASAVLSRTKRLLVLVDGPVVSMPLAVMPQNLPARLPATAADFRGADIRWLGVSHAIAYLPVLRALESRRTARLASRAVNSFAGIANPILGGVVVASRRPNYAEVFKRQALADVQSLLDFSPLPETEEEVRTISRLLNGREGDLFVRGRAREAEVKKNGLGSYRVIMFATHGVMGGEVAGMAEPGLVLTPPKSATVEDDGLLTASEIAAMKLDADLVILSACNTAASDGRPRAEGFSGLTRAFLSAGARSVIATHWAIPSVPAVAVTTAMMEGHRRDKGIPWSEALRRSFARIVESEGPPEFAHPSNWAAFAVVGAEANAAGTRWERWFR